MKYLLLEEDNVEYWIETDEKGCALRQIIIDNDDIQISCKSDCLAEGIISPDEFDGDIKKISNKNFEEKWNSILLGYQEKWGIQKNKYYLGKEIVAQIKYFYPQGIILQIDENTQGICKYDECKKYIGDLSLYPGYIIKGNIVGYDDTNMWLIISDFIN